MAIGARGPVLGRLPVLWWECPDAPNAPRAPKVSVTRERVSLCQKGVTPWLLFLVNCFCAWKRAKTSRGAGGVLPSTRPPAVERGRTPLEGGLGGSLVGRVIHNGALFNRVLIARSAHH